MNRILVVDDDPAVVDAIRDMLSADSFASVGAHDQASAENLMRGEFFPVILADLRIRSQEEGLHLLEQIRRASPRSAVVTITGSADDVMKIRLEALGSRMVLLKPVDPDVLLSLVREMLGEFEACAALLEPEEGIDTLYAALKPRLRSLACRRYGFTGEEADDLIQQAWLLYVEKRASIRAIAAWMTGTILNLCKQEIQGRYRQRAFEGASHETESVFSGADDARIAIRQALDTLDGRGRELCVRIGLERQSYGEVSDAMGLPIGSIGPLFIRAKDRMRNHLASA